MQPVQGHVCCTAGHSINLSKIDSDEKETRSELYGAARTNSRDGTETAGCILSRKEETTKNQPVAMATVKVKYRPSVQEGKEGTIYYQIIHNRIIHQIRTDYRIFMEEWDKNKSSVTVITGGRKTFLRTVSDDVARDLKRLNAIIGRLEEGGDVFTADDVVKKFLEPADGQSFFRFMEEVIARLGRLSKTRTSETYTAALNSFMRFRGGRDVPPDEIDSDMMEEYEALLKGRGVSMNTYPSTIVQ